MSIFRGFIENSQVRLKSDKNNRYFTCRPVYIYGNTNLKFFLEWEMFQTKVVEKIKTHISCSITFPKSSRLWDNVGKYGRARHDADDNVMWRMRLAFWVTGYTHTHAHTHTHAIFLSFHGNSRYANAPPAWYVHCLSCFLFAREPHRITDSMFPWTAPDRYLR